MHWAVEKALCFDMASMAEVAVASRKAMLPLELMPRAAWGWMESSVRDLLWIMRPKKTRARGWVCGGIGGLGLVAVYAGGEGGLVGLFRLLLLWELKREKGWHGILIGMWCLSAYV